MICLECDKEFIKTSRSQKICSKECIRSRKKNWRINNPEKVIENRKKWATNNPEKVIEHKKKWATNNSEKVRENKKKWATNNPEKVRENRKKWGANNPEKVIEYRKKWATNNPEKVIEYRKKYTINNSEKIRERRKKWVANNPEKVRANNIKNMKTYRIKYKDDPIRKMQHNMRSAMWGALSGKRKSQPTMDIIGCNVEELYQHFESCSSWEPWMTKENYGRNGWDVDHIIAISKWDSNCPLQFALCWDKSNLQPLDHIANIKKGSK